jgi:hypothetical protein
VDHLVDEGAVLDKRGEKPTEGILGGDFGLHDLDPFPLYLLQPLSWKRVETAGFAEGGISRRLADEGGGGGMLKHDAGEHEVPHGPDGIVVAPLAAQVLEVFDELRVRKVVPDEDETGEVIRGIYILPLEEGGLL